MKITDGAKQLLEKFLTKKGQKEFEFLCCWWGLRVTIYDELRSTQGDR